MVLAFFIEAESNVDLCAHHLGACVQSDKTGSRVHYVYAIRHFSPVGVEIAEREWPKEIGKGRNLQHSEITLLEELLPLNTFARACVTQKYALSLFSFISLLLFLWFSSKFFTEI